MIQTGGTLIVYLEVGEAFSCIVQTFNSCFSLGFAAHYSSFNDLGNVAPSETEQ